MGAFAFARLSSLPSNAATQIDGKVDGMTNQRRDQRVQVAFDAHYSSGRRDGAARLIEFSHTEALLADASLLPGVGTTVHMYVFVQPDVPIELVGEVVCHSGGQGFTLEYKELSPDVMVLVDTAEKIGAVGQIRASCRGWISSRRGTRTPAGPSSRTVRRR